MPAVAGEGFVIVDVLVFVVMLVLVAMLWLLVQARAPAGRLPVAGSLVVSAIDGLRGQITHLFGAFGAFLDWQQAQAAGLWDGFVHQVMGPALDGLHSLSLSAQRTAEHLASSVVPALDHQLGSLQSLVVHTVQPILSALQATVAADERYVQQVIAVDLAAATAGVLATEQELANLQGQVVQLTGQLLAAQAVLAQLLGYGPLLQQLQGVTAGAQAGVSVLEQDVARQQAAVATIEAELARVLGLSGIAALGAVAIANLIRIARDPCGICPGLDLSGVQSRLTALELFGEV